MDKTATYTAIATMAASYCKRYHPKTRGQVYLYLKKKKLFDPRDIRLVINCLYAQNMLPGVIL